ncbi:MAG: tRNA (adenosine(37)-N6)-threonylcarbamoyltransferase complex ATPase subunit type 1 TsaE [Patescibacteria group bacterium]
MKFITKSPEETYRVAQKLIEKLNPGDILALKGNLGSGKTCFAQGLAMALGVKKTVTSPTFTLLKIYPVKSKQIKKIYHFDLYRINNEKEFLNLGFEEIYKKKDGIIVIEWPERAKKNLPQKTINIIFKFIDENIREIEIPRSLFG